MLYGITGGSFENISVAELRHISSAPAPDIFFRLRLQIKKISAPASPIKARHRPAPDPKTDFDTKHLKNLNFNVKKSELT